MDGPHPPEPGGGRYFLVGLLAVAVIVLGVVVINHPTIGPVRAVGTLLGLEPAPAPPTRP